MTPSWYIRVVLLSEVFAWHYTPLKSMWAIILMTFSHRSSEIFQGKQCLTRNIEIFGIYTEFESTNHRQQWIPRIRYAMTSSNGNIFRVTGHFPSPVNSPHKGQWREALMFSLTCARMNDWVNSHEAGDLTHHHAHYDVIVMNCKPDRTATLMMTRDLLAARWTIEE